MAERLKAAVLKTAEPHPGLRGFESHSLRPAARGPADIGEVAERPKALAC